MNSRYQLKRLLNTEDIAGHGDIWVAERVDGDGSEVIVKRPKKSTGEHSPLSPSSFLLERTILTDPDIVEGGSAWIVKAIDFGDSFIVMEKLGKSLAQERCGIKWESYRALLRQLLKALDLLHRHGIYHHDIKPSNILRVPEKAGEVKLCDFSSATHKGTPITRDLLPVYTLGYYPPPGRAALQHVDLWGLGVTNLQMLCGSCLSVSHDDPFSAKFWDEFRRKYFHRQNEEMEENVWKYLRLFFDAYNSEMTAEHLLGHLDRLICGEKIPLNELVPRSEDRASSVPTVFDRVPAGTDAAGGTVIYRSGVRAPFPASRSASISPRMRSQAALGILIIPLLTLMTWFNLLFLISDQSIQSLKPGALSLPSNGRWRFLMNKVAPKSVNPWIFRGNEVVLTNEAIGSLVSYESSGELNYANSAFSDGEIDAKLRLKPRDRALLKATPSLEVELQAHVTIRSGRAVVIPQMLTLRIRREELVNYINQNCSRAVESGGVMWKIANVKPEFKGIVTKFSADLFLRVPYMGDYQGMGEGEIEYVFKPAARAVDQPLELNARLKKPLAAGLLPEFAAVLHPLRDSDEPWRSMLEKVILDEVTVTEFGAGAIAADKIVTAHCRCHKIN